MSFGQYEEYIGYDIIDKNNDDNNKLIMIYKPNENKKEKQEKIKIIREKGFIEDDEKDYREDTIRIFGKYFVKRNKNKSLILYNNKKYRLKEYFDEINNNYNHDIKKIKLKLIGINNITNFEKMFYGCYHLFSISESKNENLPKYNFQSYDIFIHNNTCSSLLEDNIKKGNNTNLSINYEMIGENKKLFNLYNGCALSSLENLSSVSKIGNNYYIKNSLNMTDKIEDFINFNQPSFSYINNITNINQMFSGCITLISLPDISKWDTSKVINMEAIFNECNSLLSLPDISKWNTSNVTNMKYIFNGCNKLISLPDISQWNTSNVSYINSMFSECNLLIALPDISKWDTSKVINMEGIFNECNSLISLPDISKWNTSNVTDIKYIFNDCYSLVSLPNI